MAKRPRRSSTSRSKDFMVYKNDDLPNNFVSTFQEMKDNKELCDIEIKMGNRSISAHRLVLAASIPHFYQKFCVGNDKIVELDLNEMDPIMIENIINYSYSGEIEIDRENLKNLIHFAEKFELIEIFEKCVEFMIADLSLDNVFKYKATGNSVSSEYLIEAADNYICKNFSQVALLPEFLKFSFEELSKLITNDDLNVTKEEEVYEAVMRWVKFDQESRFAVLPQIFNKIRLTSVSIEYLFDVVSAEKLVKESVACCETLEEAKKYHSLLNRKKIPLTLSNVQPRNCVATKNETIYVFCGSNMYSDEWNNSVVVYKNGEWKKVASMINEKIVDTSTILNGKVYITGGIIGDDYSSTIEVFNPKTNEWSKGKALSAEKGSFGVATLNDSIYISGGRGKDHCLSEVERFSESSQEWEEVAPLDNLRSNHGVVSLNGCLYVFGGRMCKKTLKSCEKYCPDENEWKVMDSMNVRRKLFGYAVYDGRIYVCGGQKSNNEILSSCEVYDPEADVWTLIAPMQIERRTLGLTCCNGKLYAIGGHSYDGCTSSVEEYCPEKDEWKFVTPFPNIACVVLALAIPDFD